jgi:hypothetical protein
MRKTPTLHKKVKGCGTRKFKLKGYSTRPIFGMWERVSENPVARDLV